MSYLYNVLLYNPLLNILVFFYNTIALGDLGFAIILLTVFIRLILFPIFHKSIKHQATMQKLQPELKKIEEKHKGDRERQGKEIMAFYKENNINPFSGFLFLLVQFPILIALYQIFLRVSRPDFLSGLYSVVSRPASINASFLGLINLTEGSILMVGLAALAQYFQGVLSLPRIKDRDPSPAEKMGRQMVYLAPIITVVIFYRLPAAVSLYWLIATIFSIFQQIVINKNGESRIVRKEGA